MVDSPMTDQLSTTDTATTAVAATVPNGIILPPPDIRDLVETIAPFVVRNGINFEDRLREKEKHNPKFCFLNPFDPYYKFYAHRLNECRTGTATSIPAPTRTPTSNISLTTGQPGSQSAQAITLGTSTTTKRLEKPKAFTYSASLPPISALDLDIVRLTAQFVARNGRQFITTLSQRESRNFQFDFLRSNHSLYPFFNTLVSQYSSILAPHSASLPNSSSFPGTSSSSGALTTDRHEILDRVVRRADYEKDKAKAAQSAIDEAAAEKVAYAQIDWHDFKIVETIEFTDADEGVTLPPPVELETLKSATLEVKKMMSMMDQPSLALPVSRNYELPDESGYRLRITDGSGPSMRSSESGAGAGAAAAGAGRGTGLAGAPGGVGGAGGAERHLPVRPVPTSLCPRCNGLIPTSDLEEHMRIELLDPRWKEQRERANAKKSSTNLYVDDVALNIKRLAGKRADVFEGGASGDVKRTKVDDIGPQRK